MYLYSGYLMKTSWSFGNDFAKNVVILGAGKSS